LSSRTFSTTPIPLAKSSKQKLAEIHADIPPYPHGPARWYKQSNFGLFGGQRIRFGNNVSSETEIKTRRRWRPNIQHKRLWSIALNKYVQVKVSTRVLRTIDKCGGIDEYLMGEKAARVKELGMKGWELRWRICQTPWWKSRVRQERKRLGLVALEREEERALKGTGAAELIGRDGKLVSEEMLAEQVKAYDEEVDRDEVVLEDEEGKHDNFMVEQLPGTTRSNARV
jgi:large subunit ribosomal protein L28